MSNLIYNIFMEKIIQNGTAVLKVTSKEIGGIETHVEKGEFWTFRNLAVLYCPETKMSMILSFPTLEVLVSHVRSISVKSGHLLYPSGKCSGEYQNGKRMKSYEGDCYYTIGADCQIKRLGALVENGALYVDGNRFSFFDKYVGLKQKTYSSVFRNEYNPKQIVCVGMDFKSYDVWYDNRQGMLERTFADMLLVVCQSHGMLLNRNRHKDIYYEKPIVLPSLLKRCKELLSLKKPMSLAYGVDNTDYLYLTAPRSFSEALKDSVYVLSRLCRLKPAL